MEPTSILIELDLQGPDLSKLDDAALLKIIEAAVIPQVLDAVKVSQVASRDWSGTISGSTNSSGGWQAGGNITHTWKGGEAKRDGSVTVGGSVGAGGNWSVNGGVTIKF